MTIYNLEKYKHYNIFVTSASNKEKVNTNGV